MKFLELHDLIIIFLDFHEGTFFMWISFGFVVILYAMDLVNWLMIFGIIALGWS
jgi:hypothetical protein